MKHVHDLCAFPHIGAFESTQLPGSGNDVLGTTRHIERWRSDLELLRSASLMHLRYSVPSRIERVPGVFDFSCRRRLPRDGCGGRQASASLDRLCVAGGSGICRQCVRKRRTRASAVRRGSRCSPAGIFCGHTADQGPNLVRQFGPTAARPGAPAPPELERRAMPPDHSLGASR
jgi:hypothetical protein